MKVYRTNAALGYRQYAFLIRLDESEHGHNYLCVDTQNTGCNDNYRIGGVVEDLEDIYIEEEIKFDMKQSPLSNTFLFEHFLKTYKIK